jgi:hypothetical protein
MSDKSYLPSIAQRLELENISRPEFINAMVHLYRGELGEDPVVDDQPSLAVY